MAKSTNNNSKKNSTTETSSSLAPFIAYHEEVLQNSLKVKAGDKETAVFDTIQNCSGGILIIPDLKTSTDDEGLTLQVGEKKVLTTEYDIPTINRHRRGLLTAMKKESRLYPNLPQLLNLESPEAELPLDVSIHNPPAAVLRDTKGVGGQITLPPNSFDKKLYEVIKEGEESTRKLVRQAQNNPYSEEQLQLVREDV